jgi:SAM-dependent methyltransferase
MQPPPNEAFKRMREGSLTAVDALTDLQVDALLPPAARQASGRYWTPVAVARRTAQILDELGVRRVLDVGSGPGKFCVIAGARAPRIDFVGVEHRAHLVASAQALASEVGIQNATFQHDDATRLPWTQFEAVYIFNSFAENGFAREDQFDQSVELSRQRRLADVLRVKRQLATAPAGTVLLTYYGLGGPIPGSYERLHVEAVGTGWLQVWRHVGPGLSDTYWIEDDDDAFRASAAGVRRYLSRPIVDDGVVADAD